MRFGKIDNIIVLGGSPLLAEFARSVRQAADYSVRCFSCERQLKEVIGKNGETLRKLLDRDKITYYSSDDICKDKRFLSSITKTTLGLGFGEPWRFDGKTIKKFEGRLLDFMGIRLPQYRGGAHYSWQILRRNKTGCCNLQLINEEMIQGIFDSGEIVKSKEYLFPPTLRIPQDYFDFAVRVESEFLNEFLREVKAGRDFELTKIQENFSIYFPRLYTRKHGFINWSWKTDDIATFICAFDSPYNGASTFLDGKRVFLKDCYPEFNDGPFHPFQSGLIYRKNQNAIFAATVDGTVVIKSIKSEKGADLKTSIAVGQRLYTPADKLEESLYYSAVYDTKDIK